jgi:thiol:disulfide interchange protein DsbG
MTHRRHFLISTSLGLAALGSLSTLVACSKKDEAAAAPIDAAQSYDVLAKEGRGFTVGAMMSTTTVYVLFDPQCPHCGHLWQQSLPLHKRVKFVWMPVAFISPKSAPQGAALIAAANPTEAMNDHETSILAGTGGMSASSSIPDDIAAAIKHNTELFNRMGVASVPHVVGKNVATGQVVNRTGAMQTADLAALIGI